MTGNPMQALCGAHCRTTGLPCKNFQMANGRCRMHGGKSTGRPSKHGYFTKPEITRRDRTRLLLKQINQLLVRIDTGPPINETTLQQGASKNFPSPQESKS